MENKSDFNKSDFNSDKYNNTKADMNNSSLSDESKAKAASLLDFINNVKEHSAYMEENNLSENSDKASDKAMEHTENSLDSDETTLMNDKELDGSAQATLAVAEPTSAFDDTVTAEMSEDQSDTSQDTLVAAEPTSALDDTVTAEMSEDQSDTSQATLVAAEPTSALDDTVTAEMSEDQSDTSQATLVAAEPTSALDDTVTTEMSESSFNNFSDETQAVEKPMINSASEQTEFIFDDTEESHQWSDEIEQDKLDGASAFGAGFNPSFAFYDDEDTDTTPKTFTRVNDKNIASERNEAKALHGEKELPSYKTEENKKVSVTALKPKANPIKANKPKEIQKQGKTTEKSPGFLKKIENKLMKQPPKKLMSSVAAAVFIIGLLVTGGVMTAKGLIPALASDDIYGIFVNGRLVAASNQSGKIEEAIDDFMSYYKHHEEQGSLTNVRFSSSYEIRQLSKDEIKEQVFTDKNTTKATTASTVNNSNSGDSTDSTATQATTEKTTETTVSQTDANGNTTHATTNQSNPMNEYEDKITISKNISELQNVLFYGSEPKTYTVVEGDNLYKIAKRENLTLTELMVPNPDLLEDSTIGIDQEIRIVKMSGPLKLSFSREVTVTEDIPYETVEEKTDELFEGEKKVAQKGKEGIRQEITKYDYENNVISVKTPISDERLEEPTKKIVKVGTKKKISPEQSSGHTEHEDTPADTSSGYMWPVSGARMTSKFGPRRSPKKGASSYHRGIDLAIASGTPIYATQSGTVTISSRAGGYGNLVEINHGGGMTSRYGHCSVLKVKRGQKVEKGQLIALVGNTGVSTGPHLHFEVRKNGTAVNPLNYLK